MSKPFRILLLAGTSEARQLAEQLSAVENIEVIASLAGVTQDPKPYPVETRTGGFGGPEGLARYIDDQGIDLILNASHPFARLYVCQRCQRRNCNPDSPIATVA